MLIRIWINFGTALIQLWYSFGTAYTLLFFSHFRLNQATNAAESTPLSKLTMASIELNMSTVVCELKSADPGSDSATPNWTMYRLKNFLSFS